MNQLLGQLGNLHRLPHIQHEHITTLPHGTSLDHQLSGLGNGHEVAGDLRVGHSHRPTVANLLVEARNHRARGAQHITETHHGEARLVDVMYRVISAKKYRRSFTTQRLQNHLCHTLGTAHHIGGPHSLVGRDQNEVGHPGLHRRLGGVHGAKHIIKHAFRDIVFHHGHMLVRRCVVDRLHLPGAHHVQQALGITDGAHDRHQPHR